MEFELGIKNPNSKVFILEVNKLVLIFKVF